MPGMPAVERAAAKRSRGTLLWVMGGLIFVVCALVTTSGGVSVFILPEDVPTHPSGQVGREGPGVDSWDYWVDPGTPRHLAASVSVVAVLAFLAFAAMIIILIISRVRLRRRARDAVAEPEQVAVEFDRVIAARAVADAVDEALTQLGSTREFDDAIIQCWHGLQSAAAESGLPRRPSETSTEYVARLIDDLRLTDDVTLLARLYREARFSDHRVPESARALAQRALSDIRDGIRAGAFATGSDGGHRDG